MEKQTQVRQTHTREEEEEDREKNKASLHPLACPKQTSRLALVQITGTGKGRRRNAMGRSMWCQTVVCCWIPSRLRTSCFIRPDGSANFPWFSEQEPLADRNRLLTGTLCRQEWYADKNDLWMGMAAAVVACFLGRQIAEALCLFTRPGLCRGRREVWSRHFSIECWRLVSSAHWPAVRGHSFRGLVQQLCHTPLKSSFGISWL